MTTGIGFRKGPVPTSTGRHDVVVHEGGCCIPVDVLPRALVGVHDLELLAEQLHLLFITTQMTNAHQSDQKGLLIPPPSSMIWKACRTASPIKPTPITTYMTDKHKPYAGWEWWACLNV